MENTPFGIPIIGCTYSAFDQLPNYASVTRYIAVPAVVLAGLWMWKGHRARRMITNK